MKSTIAIIVIASIIISVLVFSYNYINVCVADINNGRYTVSECIDNNLINSTLIIISSVALCYIFILLLKLRPGNNKDDPEYKTKLLTEYYNKKPDIDISKIKEKTENKEK